MRIKLGETQVSMLNPPNEGDVIERDTTWHIQHNSQGLIVLRFAGQCHPEFRDGMDLEQFCWWINQHDNNWGRKYPKVND